MEYYNETYELEIIHEPAEDGLTRYGLTTTKATGLNDMYHVEEILSIFQCMADKMPGSKVKIGRTIKFYCHACRCLIGEKTIPLRIESYRSHRFVSPDTSIDINVEYYRCVACGHHTGYPIQDPIVRCY